jgi:hypothetical protein
VSGAAFCADMSVVRLIQTINDKMHEGTLSL